MAVRRRRKYADDFDGKPRTQVRVERIDTDSQWRPLVRDLADSLGHTEKFAWFWFRQIALAVEFHTEWPQSLCEWRAFHLVGEALDKRGQAAS